MEEKEFKKWFYTHKRVKSAVRSIEKTFTLSFYPKLNISNTTNHLDDGEFSFLKRLLRNHNGVLKELKLKIINKYFENHKNKIKKRGFKSAGFFVYLIFSKIVFYLNFFMFELYI